MNENTARQGGDNAREAVETLAIALFAAMERLDPSGHFDWNKSARQNWERAPHQSFYIVCVQSILTERLALQIALSSAER